MNGYLKPRSRTIMVCVYTWNTVYLVHTRILSLSTYISFKKKTNTVLSMFFASMFTMCCELILFSVTTETFSQSLWHGQEFHCGDISRETEKIAHSHILMLKSSRKYNFHFLQSPWGASCVNNLGKVFFQWNLHR